MKVSPNRARAGFSLIELVITMTIMAILVGVVSMRSGTVTDKARASKIMAVTETFRTACEMYYSDTAASPYEYSGYQGASNHRLSMDPGVSGWQGPYINSPITRSQNPVGSTVHLYNRLVSGYTNTNGIDVDGDGTADYAADAPGNILVFWGIPEGLAEMVDQSFDRDLPGDWKDAGDVEWASNRLTVVVRK